MRISDWSSGVCSSDLLDGFRVEGSPDTLDFRLMRFERNDIRVPPRGADDGRRDEALLPTSALLVSPGPFAWAELHWRLGTPVLAAEIGRASWREGVWKYV